MATTYYKLSGEILTAAEAQTAASSYSPPAGYEFKHWSSNPNSDVEVPELNTGGLGVVITSDKTYYPVVEIILYVTLVKVGSTIDYTILDGADYEGEIYSGGITNTSHRVFRIQGIGSSAAYDIDQGISGDTTGSETYDAYSCYCDFGEVTLPSVAGVTGYQITSDVDGETYFLKVYASVNGANMDYTIEVYKLIGGVITDITNTSYLFIQTLD